MSIFCLISRRTVSYETLTLSPNISVSWTNVFIVFICTTSLSTIVSKDFFVNINSSLVCKRPFMSKSGVKMSCQLRWNDPNRLNSTGQKIREIGSKWPSVAILDSEKCDHISGKCIYKSCSWRNWNPVYVVLGYQI